MIPIAITPTIPFLSRYRLYCSQPRLTFSDLKLNPWPIGALTSLKMVVLLALKKVVMSCESLATVSRVGLVSVAVLACLLMVTNSYRFTCFLSMLH